jgi:hypothetical protein
MLTPLENEEHVDQLPIAREKREERLASKHSREKLSHEHLEKMADFITDAMAQFLPEISGTPIVYVMLSTPEAPSRIVLQIDGGKVVDVTDDDVPL